MSKVVMSSNQFVSLVGAASLLAVATQAIQISVLRWQPMDILNNGGFAPMSETSLHAAVLRCHRIADCDHICLIGGFYWWSDNGPKPYRCEEHRPTGPAVFQCWTSKSKNSFINTLLTHLTLTISSLNSKPVVI